MIATEGTIRSGAWEKNLKQTIPEIEVINKACPMLANVAEEGKAKSQEGRMAIKEYMKPFKTRKIKNIILGCTHYPIYDEIIREELGYEVNLINTGKTVANHLKNILGEEKNKIQTEKIFLSKPSKEFKEIAKTILGEEIQIRACKDLQ